MCLGGSAAPKWKPPAPKVIQPGPESPQDKVNNVEVPNINDPSQQKYHQNKNKGTTATKQSSKTDKAY